VLLYRLTSSGPGGISRLDELQTYDANDLGLVVVVGIPLTLLTLTTSGRLGKYVSLATLGAIGATIARTGSRGAFVGLVVVGFMLLVWLRQFKLWKRLMFVGVTGAAIAVAAPAGYWQQMQTILNPEQDYNWNAKNGRREIALRAWGYFKAYPIFGLGINNFQMAEGTISPLAENYLEGMPGIKWSAAHNSFIQVGTEMGPAGLVLWSALILGGIIGMRRLRRRLPKQWAKGDREQRFIYASTLYLPVALAGFAVSAAFVSFAYLDPIYLLATYVTGIYTCAQDRLRRERAVALADGNPVAAVPTGRAGRRPRG
jgi:O-antigen ligase